MKIFDCTWLRKCDLIAITSYYQLVAIIVATCHVFHKKKKYKMYWISKAFPLIMQAKLNYPILLLTLHLQIRLNN